MDAKGWAASATAAYEAAITSKGADALYTLKQAVVLQILTREFIAQVGAVFLLCVWHRFALLLRGVWCRRAQLLQGAACIQWFEKGVG